mmetsp:Transcript_20317/g.81164  ORF Transcript_20317/g.81164 Transcript_20317/m.81164 type:complete len:353 (+) Transcript_20317:248-1306(+)
MIFVVTLVTALSLTAGLRFDAASSRLLRRPPAAVRAPPTAAAAALVQPTTLVRRLVEETKPSLAALRPKGIRNITTGGTAFVVAQTPDSLRLLTAAHVALPGFSLDVVLDDGTTIPGTVIARNTTLDLALVDVSVAAVRNTSAMMFPELRFATASDDTAYNIGDVAIALGYPGGIVPGAGKRAAFAATSGIVASVVDDVVIADAAVSGGMSGGPLLDVEGRVIGLMTTRTPIGALAVSGQACERFVAEAARGFIASTTDDAASLVARQQYEVVLFNDMLNTRQRVESVLLEVAELDRTAAGQAMMAAHTTGTGVVKTFDPSDREAADALCDRLRQADLLVEVVPSQGVVVAA